MSTEREVRALIVDDEPLARQRLEDLLRAEPGVASVESAGSGPEAVEAILRLRPNLVFLDVQMPGMTGLEVVGAVGSENMPPTIFVTAYDQFALQAFDLAALDYLVKPFDDDRFQQAFRRARRLIELEAVDRAASRLVELLQQGRGAAPDGSPPGDYLERIAVEARGQVRVVATERIDYITASGPYAELHVGDRTFVIRERMQVLEERLDPKQFCRIHRSAIVRLSTVETLLRGSGGDYAVRLRGGVELSVSRNRREELETRLGLKR